MKQATLCLLVKDGKVLLAMKKRGFGASLWNGYGGKPHPDQDKSLEDTAVRETREESGLVIDKKDLQQIGIAQFFFDDNSDWDQEVHIFLVRQWQGEPMETDEMRPQWFNVNDMPLNEMWVSDREWLPLMVRDGKKLFVQTHFNADGNEMVSCEMKEWGRRISV